MSMPDQPAGAGASCPQCGSGLPPSARFCTRCGHTLTARSGQLYAAAGAPTAVRPTQPPTTPEASDDPIVPAGVAVRSSAFLLDLAAMVSPALPLSIAAASLRTAALVYAVVPVAVVAVWAFMQTWQGLSGTTFGKSLLGLRLVGADDLQRPGVGRALLRGTIFALSLGLAALPMTPDARGRAGLHDRVTGLGVLDVTVGANPLGARPQRTLFRRAASDRSLHRVHSPVPIPTTKRD